MLDVKKVAQEKKGTSKSYKRKKKKKTRKRKKKRKKKDFYFKRKEKKRNKWLSMKKELWMSSKSINKRKGKTISCLLKSSIMKCLCTGDQRRWIDEMAAYGFGRNRHGGTTPNINEAEAYENCINEAADTTLRDAADLNHEEARALLGRLEFLKGHKEAALSLLCGIDIGATIPKMKEALSSLAYPQNQHVPQSGEPPMRLTAAILRLEAIYLKSMVLRDLGRFKEAAEECSIILDIVESALPDGPPAGSSSTNRDKLHDLVGNAADFLPELYILAESIPEAISSYRRALLIKWNLGSAIVTSLQKDFAILLLYGGCEANSPNLRYHIGSSFVPKNNLEEAILLLIIILRKCNTKQIEWDQSIVHHLTFAMSMSSQLEVLAREYEGILPSLLDKKERLYSLALCYFNEENDEASIHLLEQIVDSKDAESGSSDPVILNSLLLASKFCSDKTQYAKAAVDYAERAMARSRNIQCRNVESIGELLLGISLSSQARDALSDSERVTLQKNALQALQNAEKKTGGSDHNVLHMLALVYAEQRKLDDALKYAKRVVKLKISSDVNAWILLARIFSAQKRYTEAADVVNAGLDETGKWDQLGLLRTKAKIHTSQEQFKHAIETYREILAVIKLRTRSFSAGMEVLKGIEDDRTIEMETWYDLAHVYLSMKQWDDVELCLSRLKAISSYSVLCWHATGKLQETRGFLQEALAAYNKALDLDPAHVPSIISLAILLRKLGDRPLSDVRSLLTDALRLDRTNHVAWFQIGLLHQDEGTTVEAAECFQAAALLEETAPVEPFR